MREDRRDVSTTQALTSLAGPEPPSTAAASSALRCRIQDTRIYRRNRTTAPRKCANCRRVRPISGELRPWGHGDHMPSGLLNIRVGSSGYWILRSAHRISPSPLAPSTQRASRRKTVLVVEIVRLTTQHHPVAESCYTPAAGRIVVMPRKESAVSPESAESISQIVLRANAMLNTQLARLQTELGEAEFTVQRRLFGAAMAALLDIVNPIYRSHPQLMPIELGGSYAVPGRVFLNLDVLPPAGRA